MSAKRATAKSAPEEHIEVKALLGNGLARCELRLPVGQDVDVESDFGSWHRCATWIPGLTKRRVRRFFSPRRNRQVDAEIPAQRLKGPRFQDGDLFWQAGPTATGRKQSRPLTGRWVIGERRCTRRR